MFKTMLAVIVATAATVGSAAGQQMAQPMVAEIPFEFYSAGKVLPAGTYTISTPSAGFVRVQCQSARNGFVSAIAAGQGRHGDSADWVSFRQSGGRYVLTGIGVRGGRTFAPPLHQTERAIVSQAAITRTILLAK